MAVHPFSLWKRISPLVIEVRYYQYRIYRLHFLINSAGCIVTSQHYLTDFPVRQGGMSVFYQEVPMFIPLLFRAEMRLTPFFQRLRQRLCYPVSRVHTQHPWSSPQLRHLYCTPWFVNATGNLAVRACIVSIDGSLRHCFEFREGSHSREYRFWFEALPLSVLRFNAFTGRISDRRTLSAASRMAAQLTSFRYRFGLR